MFMSSPPGCIGCISSDRDEDFRGIFAPIGPIKSSKIVRQKATGHSYGFGFIDYQDAGDAARAIESLNGLQVLGKTIKVSYARPGGETIKHAELYIRGIPEDYPLEEAENVFANFGQLIQFRVVKDKSGSGSVIAFVLYDLRENAEAAMAKLTGTTLPGAREPLVIEYARSKFPWKERVARGPPREYISRPSGATGGSLAPTGANLPTAPTLITADLTSAAAVTSRQALFIYDTGDRLIRKVASSLPTMATGASFTTEPPVRPAGMPL
ncbi:hypothetical protein HPB48_020472 [Haemaphysalis longicornis]|uniref:RRM domain-containing protein n=1 Tax=Haemaphysalis longicornis TaxID=44386 RepID=A0A9J6FD45_HAELO|nr:hypothetical protein HPB48_020472 [Haemaphysalis longicornis]